MASIIIIAILSLSMKFDHTISLEVGIEDDRCEEMMKKIDIEDRATVTDNGSFRLHATWLSQQCEIHAGPKYVVRKYSFFENGTFLLLQFHYAEESCSVATYTVVARGSIEILLPSVTIPGTTETDVQLFSVHLIPFNRQIAHKFEHKMNSSCGGVETKWRPYLKQLVFERDTDLRAINYKFNSNSLSNRSVRSKKQYTLDCLKTFDIEFTELKLLRVGIKRSSLATNFFNRRANNIDKEYGRVELLLGEPIRNVRSEKIKLASTRLQSTVLLRADTVVGCPICGSVSRATEFSPPLFHQVPSFPAIIDGAWLSVRCESIDGGIWSRRFYRIYSDHNRWSARWTYYADSMCSNPLYAVSAAGNYVQRAIVQSRNGIGEFKRLSNVRDFKRWSRKMLISKVGSDMFEQVRGTGKLQFNDRNTTHSIRKDVKLLSGTTELELQVVESMSIPVGNTASTLCNRSIRGTNETRRIKGTSTKSRRNFILNLRWSGCMSRTVKAPATLLLKAKVSLDWNGNYILLLTSWKDDCWSAPLRRCSGTVLQNYLRVEDGFHRSVHKHLHHMTLFGSQDRNERLNRHGSHWSSSSISSYFLSSSSLFTYPILLLLFYYFFH